MRDSGKLASAFKLLETGSMSIWSPCIKVCFVDPNAEICVGCFRTMEELGRWTKMSDAERKSIGDALPAREQAYRRKKESMR